MEGAVERVRPKMMTVVAIMAGLLPIMWGTGTGSEVMSRIAAPMVGGMISSTVLTLVVIPAIYALVKEWQLRRRPNSRPRAMSCGLSTVDECALHGARSVSVPEACPAPCRSRRRS